MRINNFNLELLEGPIGISCSGGADSSLLLYLLMKHSKEKIHIFTSVSNFKQRKHHK
jgi:tRNA(Ile)-lysidine synthase TilS/MesJ